MASGMLGTAGHRRRASEKSIACSTVSRLARMVPAMAGARREYRASDADQRTWQLALRPKVWPVCGPSPEKLRTMVDE